MKMIHTISSVFGSSTLISDHYSMCVQQNCLSDWNHWCYVTTKSFPGTNENLEHPLKHPKSETHSQTLCEFCSNTTHQCAPPPLPTLLTRNSHHSQRKTSSKKNPNTFFPRTKEKQYTKIKMSEQGKMFFFPSSFPAGGAVWGGVWGALWVHSVRGVKVLAFKHVRMQKWSLLTVGE